MPKEKAIASSSRESLATKNDTPPDQEKTKKKKKSKKSKAKSDVDLSCGELSPTKSKSKVKSKKSKAKSDVDPSCGELSPTKSKSKVKSKKSKAKSDVDPSCGELSPTKSKSKAKSKKSKAKSDVDPSCGELSPTKSKPKAKSKKSKAKSDVDPSCGELSPTKSKSKVKSKKSKSKSDVDLSCGELSPTKSKSKVKSKKSKAKSDVDPSCGELSPTKSKSKVKSKKSKAKSDVDPSCGELSPTKSKSKVKSKKSKSKSDVDPSCGELSPTKSKSKVKSKKSKSKSDVKPSKESSSSHLSEEEITTVVGFSPSPKKVESTLLAHSSCVPSKRSLTSASPSLPLPSSLLSAPDCSLLMEVKQGDKMVFMNPFSKPTIQNSSDSIIIIEDPPHPQVELLHPQLDLSPFQLDPMYTSTPRPSLKPRIFLSPIAKGPAQSPVQSQASVFFETASETIVNRDNIDTNASEEKDMDWCDIAISTLNDARENTLLLQSETVGGLTELVAQKSVEKPQPDAPGKTVLVIDTNVFIRALAAIKDVLYHPLAVSGELFVMLPWVVLQELDYLKQHQKYIRHQCMSAVRFINMQLEANNPQVISQSPQQAKERKIQIESNDDKIIVCCLQKQETGHKQDRVILVTMDINLSNKAMVAGIQAANPDVSNVENFEKSPATIAAEAG